MNKPFIISKRELIDNISKAINSSELDLGIVELILQNILREVSQIAQRQGEAQIQYWESKQAENVEKDTSSPIEVNPENIEEIHTVEITPEEE